MGKGRLVQSNSIKIRLSKDVDQALTVEVWKIKDAVKPFPQIAQRRSSTTTTVEVEVDEIIIVR